MAYFVKLFDREMKVIGSDNWTKTQYAVESFTLNMNANEFDTFSCSCEEIKNSRDATYVGLFDSEGYLIYFALCGLPVTKDHITTINSYDLRKMLKQTSVFDERGDGSTLNHKYTTTDQWYQYLLETALKTCTSSPLIGIDVSELKDNAASVPWDSSVLEGKITTYDLWKILTYWNSYFGVVVLAEVSLGEEVPIQFRAHIVSSVIPINLKEYGVNVKTDMFGTNTCRTFERNLEGVISDTPNHIIVKLKNDDVMEMKNYDGSSSLDLEKAYMALDGTTAYSATRTGYGYLGGRNIFAGQTYRELLPDLRCVTDIIYDAKDASDSSDDEKDPEGDAVSKANEELCGQRAKESVTIGIDTRQALMEIYNSPEYFFLDERGNEDLRRPFRFYGKLYNYYEADGNTYKLVPVGCVSVGFSKGKRTLSVKFGFLSDYWYLQRTTGRATADQSGASTVVRTGSGSSLQLGSQVDISQWAK